jgi:hypothetical protein
VPDSTVFFYRLVNAETGTRMAQDIDAHGLLEDVEKLDKAGRRLKASNNDELLGIQWWGPADQSTPDLLVVAKIRRGGGLPAVELDGQFRNLMLAEGEGLAEPTHAAFYPGNVVAIVKSGYSPSHLRVGEWINRVLDVKPQLRLDPIIRTNVRARLAEVDEITLLTVQYDTDQMERLQSKSSRLWRALDAIRGDYGGLEATLILKPRKGDAGGQSAKLMEDVEGLVLDIPEDENAEFLQARLGFRNSETEKADSINFIQDRLTIRVPVEQKVIDDETAILSRSASRGIQAAYDRVRSQLED